MAGNSGFFGWAPESSVFHPSTEQNRSQTYSMGSGGVLQLRKPVRHHAGVWDTDTNFQGPADSSEFPHSIVTRDNGLADHREIQILKTPGGTALLGLGVTAPAAGGTLSNQDSTPGQFVQYLTSGVNGNAAGWTFNAAFATELGSWQSLDQHSAAIFRVRQVGDTASTNIRTWVGMFSADPSGSDNPAVHLAGFLYSAAATRNQWNICVNNGGTTQVRGTRFGAAATPTTVNDYVMKIEFHGNHRSTSGGAHSKIRFFMNDVFVGEFKNGNLPATTLAPLVRVTNVSAGSGRTIWFSRFAYYAR